MYFDVVYVVVIASLIVQGWTIAFAGRRLGLVRPPRPAPPPRYDIDLPTEIGRGVSIYTVQPESLSLRRTIQRLPLPPGTSLISIYRDGEMHAPDTIDRLAAGDQVLLTAPNEHLDLLDRLFGRKPTRAGGEPDQLMGEFTFSGDVGIGAIGEAYDFRVPARYRDTAVRDFMRRHLRGRLRPGRRLRLGSVEIVLRAMQEDRVSLVAVELEPEGRPLRRFDAALIQLRALAESAGERFAAFWRRLRRGRAGAQP
jgi:cell volume regulation protein A